MVWKTMRNMLKDGQLVKERRRKQQTGCEVTFTRQVDILHHRPHDRMFNIMIIGKFLHPDDQSAPVPPNCAKIAETKKKKEEVTEREDILLLLRVHWVIHQFVRRRQ
ncbi:unnamed protein product [Pleuronectes platessa]|uniref:Uncharacterized protein n=1 Tax=Pleuronectes platessa TaxID=8262 RepID=A0A9N7TYL6_PLEPL|nr:unnamed protein product [Pleuronectes platessa]